MLKLVDGAFARVEEPALTALNMRLRDDYTTDCAKSVERWNKIIAKCGLAFRLRLPHVAFHRQIGEFRDVPRDARRRTHRRRNLAAPPGGMAAVAATMAISSPP